MLKAFLTIIISLIIGFIIGVAVTVFAYPFYFPPAQVNEQVQNVAAKTIYATGTFIDTSPSDRVHWGKGNTKIYKDGKQFEVFLEKNFQVGPGPAFHVYLSESSDIKSNADFKKSVNYDLGNLKSFKSSQVYQVPQNIDMKKIKSVVIWCQAFSQLITTADLKK
jgi:hypothetical protein